MRNWKWRIVASAMAAAMMFSATAFAAETEAEAVREGGDDVLVVGYSNFSSKFSPFFSETAYDQDAWLMTQVNLITTDRVGQIIYNGIEGETNNYNGTDYTYYGVDSNVQYKSMTIGTINQQTNVDSSNVNKGRAIVFSVNGNDTGYLTITYGSKTNDSISFSWSFTAS